MVDIPRDLQKKVSDAVAYFWTSRSQQATKQKVEGKADQGLRGAVTGGAQMDGFVDLISELIEYAGIKNGAIYTRSRFLELPGFFRPTKEWDLLVVQNGRLLVAVETKSQVGSFGNNFNNRTEEAMGSALDLWTAFRESAFVHTSRPWLGYLFLLEDCLASNKPVSVREPHFKVFPEFVGASYAKRYELFCKKLVLERHYESAVFLMSDKDSGIHGKFTEPSSELAFDGFARSLIAHVGAYANV